MTYVPTGRHEHDEDCEILTAGVEREVLSGF